MKIQKSFAKYEIYERNCERKRLALLVNHIPVLTVDICHFCYQGKLRPPKLTYLYSSHMNLMEAQLQHWPCPAALFSISATFFSYSGQKSIIGFWEVFCEW